ncbi:imidazole glycerol phosphate synthase subunit HisH [Sporolactobacillus vineae]|uniref:imidazole glycerol phosphate synthase subunit HisH n=1 Tax=Sporolactobacillus vineae TaxID=444463 RepID=UPI000287D7CE|nr:imidazole glycerol phosphate synthase subunit HisH [Sporolactobacillus vineae]
MIGIVDYGMGNLYSLSRALIRLEEAYFISDNENELAKADGLILPGVGAFRDAMLLLNQKKLTGFIRHYAAEKPLLGICLGMQLLFDESEEGRLTEGLKLLPGRVVRFSGIDNRGISYKVPHMGWNMLTFRQPEAPLLTGLKPDYAYFVHSYYVQTPQPDILTATTDYHQEVPAVVGRGSVFGTQFHPEKSGAFGQSLLGNFLKYAAGSMHSRQEADRREN